jgi:glycine/D-amino acid oxidase-like deaminating enzyme
MKTDFDTIIIGGGLVGAAVACGIGTRGNSVAILDGVDRDFRASRGNFGLVWVQGKGANHAGYAQWSGIAAKMWPAFETELRDATGIDIGFHQNGGFNFCLSEQELQARSEEMRRVERYTQGAFEYRMLEHAELKQKFPQISDDVLGASFSPQDGHLNPLYLLRALHQYAVSSGCVYRPRQRVNSIRSEAGGFMLQTESASYTAAKVVLCAGLDNQRLAKDLEMSVPVHPIRGQLLITERVKPFLRYPSLQIRQTDEGTLQIGDSHEEVGLDSGTTLDVITVLARRAVRIFPHLRNVKLNRAWGALRVMTPDGMPVYHRSERYPDAFALSCHSGVSLAAAHVGKIADWICGDSSDALIPQFSADRFDVSKTQKRSA